MNVFCLLLGHTWVPDTSAPDPHWHTTKKGDVLHGEAAAGEVRYFDRCRRCGTTRDVPMPRAGKREASQASAPGGAGAPGAP